MLKYLFRIIILLAMLAQMGIAQAGDPADQEGSKDPPIFNRMPGFHIYRSEELDFDQYEFEAGPKKTQMVEGRRYTAIYYANEGIKRPSGLQIIRNYVNAVKAIGGQQVYQFEDGGREFVILKVIKNNAEVWARIAAASNGMYDVNMVVKQAMNQDVVANASVLAGSIKDTGKVAIYGIYFDTGKAVIKPESEPSLKEIAKLLQADAKLKVHIVGHTDNAGVFDANMKLSRERAEAVVKTLVNKYNIAGIRMQGAGIGPLSPASSNLTEEGRSKNRRVELVAQ